MSAALDKADSIGSPDGHRPPVQESTVARGLRPTAARRAATTMEEKALSPVGRRLIEKGWPSAYL
jgi:hypothetical protein